MPQGTRSTPTTPVDGPEYSFGSQDADEKTPDRLRAESWSRKTRPYGRKEFPTMRRHGTRGAYNDGCGCEDCTRAERLYSRKRSIARSKDPVGLLFKRLRDEVRA